MSDAKPEYEVLISTGLPGGAPLVGDVLVRTDGRWVVTRREMEPEGDSRWKIHVFAVR